METDRVRGLLMLLKNNPYVSVVIVFGFIVVGISHFTGAVSGIINDTRDIIGSLYKHGSILNDNVPPADHQGESVVKLNNKTVLVTPFENNTVGRDAAGLRDTLENIVVKLGGKPVERNQLDSILQELQFGASSGMVDSNQAAKLGRMIGARYVLVGSIGKIDKEQKRFSGYNISTSTTVVTATVRVRLIDAESSTIVFSRSLTASQSSLSSKYGGSQGANMEVGALEDALRNLDHDRDLQSVLSGEN